MDEYIIVGDVDHVQGYVFASTRLRAIRGASVLLSQIADEIQRQWENKVNLLRWRGGQIVAIVKADTETNANQFCHELERIFRERSSGDATLTTASGKYDKDNFRDSIGKALSKIQRKKESQNGRREALLTSPYQRRCDLLPNYPATNRAEIADDEVRYLSSAANARCDAVTQEKSFDRKLLDAIFEGNPYREDGKQIKLAYQLDHLFSEREERPYIALAMADGMGFGRLLSSIKTADLYTDYSNQIDDLAIQAIAQAARAISLNSKVIKYQRRRAYPDYFIPLVPVILAGDDFAFLLRKENAVPFVQHFCEAFESLSTDSKKYKAIQHAINEFRNEDPAGEMLFPKNMPAKLTLSAGIAIAKKNFPISALQRFAGELRHQAKREFWRLRQNPATAPESVVDFAAITTANVQPLDELRQHYSFDETPERPKDDLGKSWTEMTERPYTLLKFKKLKELAKSLRELPSSKRKYLYRAFWQGRGAATEAYRFILSRESRETRDKIQSQLAQLGIASPDRISPFRDEQTEPSTPLLDALELAELLGD